jgi:GNAT superfamily N-acetyltransferase
MDNIEIARTDEEILATYAVMSQLRPHILVADYLELVKVQAQSGYQLATLRQEELVTCVAGFRLSDSLAWGRHLYVDDLITDGQRRSHGAGKAMFDWLVRYARAHQCSSLQLDSGVQRHQAHRFYLRERMDIVSYHFRLSL